MKILLDDNGLHLRFAPLTLTRPVGMLRIGGLTNSERYQLLDPGAEIFYKTESYLSDLFPACEQPDLVVNAAVIPDVKLAAVIFSLEANDDLWYGDNWIAGKGERSQKVEYKGEKPLVLGNRWDLYTENALAIESDFYLLTKDRVSAPLSETNTVIGDPSRIFLEEGAVIECAILNVKSGPIYIGKNAEIMEGSVVRGGLMMAEGSALKLSSKIYGPTTLGPHCKVGGEVNNVIFQAYSNKGHDGFLGNALIGEWCNIGADSNCSNLKNNYGNVDTYSYESREFVETDVQFMGLCMGDHSKCGINTMFNTGTVTGVSANIFGAGFPDKFIPSFSWGGSDGFVPFRFDKAVEYANNMMSRRGRSLSEHEIKVLQYIFNQQ